MEQQHEAHDVASLPVPPPAAQNGSDAAIACPPEVLALEAAARRGHVTFHQVAGAWFRAHDREHPAEAEHFRRVFPQLLQVFGDQRGGVITACFCQDIPVAAALTGISEAARQEGALDPRPIEDAARDSSVVAAPPPAPRRRWLRRVPGSRQLVAVSTEHASNTAIHIEPIFGHPNDTVAKDILFRCLGLHYRALEFLRPKARKICIRMIFNLVVSLLGTMDARVQGDKLKPLHDDRRERDCLEGEYRRIERYYQRAALRGAQLDYFLGMGLGLAPLLALAFALRFVLPAPNALSVALLAGGIGGVLSVMHRMTSNRLALDHEAGRSVIWLLGGIRPWVGGAFGLALFVLVSGGLITLVEIPEGVEELYWVAGLSFLAGFVERLAPDVFESSPLSRGAARPTPASEPGQVHG